MRLNKKLFTGLFILIIVSIIYFFRPWIHSFVIYFVRNPIFIEIVLVWGVVNWFLLKRKGKHSQKRKPQVEVMDDVEINILGSSYINFSVMLLFFLIMAASIFSGIIVPLELSHTLNYKEISALPDSSSNVRLMPRNVACRYAKDSLQLSQYKLGTENIVNINGSLAWTFPLVPDGELLQFLIKNKGIVIVDATVQEKNAKIIEKDLEIGETMQIFDNLFWNLYKEKYLVDFEDPYYITWNNEIYTIVPTISYEYKFYYGLVYALPKFDGVFVVSSDGTIEFLDPARAQESDLLKNNRIFPEELARLYIDSYAFKDGLINYFFIHKDQIDIQDLDSNRQPFLLDTEKGLKWFVSTEPYGKSHGVFKIFLIDARTGDIERLELPSEDTLTGPVKATDFVRKSNPIVDWTRFRIVEPLPFSREGKLYWKVVVVPYDSAGIAYQAFIDAETNKVVELKTNKEILEFIKGIHVPKKEEEVEEKEDYIAQIKQKIKEVEELINKLEEQN